MSNTAWCMYQVKDGVLINQLFEPHSIPDDWYDSPDAAKVAVGLPPKYPEAYAAKNGNPVYTHKIDDKVKVTIIKAESNALNVTDAAAKLADENNIDLFALIGTGKDGAILKGDVVKAIGD